MADFDNFDKPIRDANGRFLPGTPPCNPSGRRPMTDEQKQKKREAEEILIAATPSAARKLVDMLESDDYQVALKAAMAIIERVMGKPKQAVEMMGADGSEMTVTLKMAGPSEWNN